MTPLVFPGLKPWGNVEQNSQRQISKEGYTDYNLVAYNCYRDKTCDWLKFIITKQTYIHNIRCYYASDVMLSSRISYAILDT